MILVPSGFFGSGVETGHILREMGQMVFILFHYWSEFLGRGFCFFGHAVAFFGNFTHDAGDYLQPFLEGVQQGDCQLRTHDGEDDAGESGSGADIDVFEPVSAPLPSKLLEQLIVNGGEGVGYIFHREVLGRGKGGEVYRLVEGHYPLVVDQEGGNLLVREGRQSQ